MTLQAGMTLQDILSQIDTREAARLLGVSTSLIRAVRNGRPPSAELMARADRVWGSLFSPRETLRATRPSYE